MRLRFRCWRCSPYREINLVGAEFGQRITAVQVGLQIRPAKEDIPRCRERIGPINQHRAPDMKTLWQVIVLWDGNDAAMLPPIRTKLAMPQVEMAHIRRQKHESPGRGVAQLIIIGKAPRLFLLGGRHRHMALSEIPV